MEEIITCITCVYVPDSKVHWANMGPTWVLSAPDGPYVGPTNLAIRMCYQWMYSPHFRIWYPNKLSPARSTGESQVSSSVSIASGRSWHIRWSQTIGLFSNVIVNDMFVNSCVRFKTVEKRLSLKQIKDILGSNASELKSKLSILLPDKHRVSKLISPMRCSWYKYAILLLSK